MLLKKAADIRSQSLYITTYLTSSNFYNHNIYNIQAKTFRKLNKLTL